MRDEFVKTLINLASNDPNIVLITGDLGFGVLSPFIEKFPKQYLNAGVAEQNMTGIAAGMALEGKTVFTYSIANFNTFRCLEQIRNDICYHSSNVKIISIGGGFCYGALGISHHATEDLAILRSIPNLTVLAPGDRMETRLAVQASYSAKGPFFLRLGRGGESLLYDEEPDFKVGKGIIHYDGSDVVLFSTGGMLKSTLKAHDILSEMGIPSSVCSMHSIQPFDKDLTKDFANKTKLLVSIEEHIINGGLGSCIAEVISEMRSRKTILLRLGLPSEFTCEVGDQDHLRSLHGLSPTQIAKSVAKKLNELT